MKQAAIYGGLLAVALVGSYLSWTADDEAASRANDVLVLRASEDDLGTLVWTDDRKTIAVERREDDRGTYLHLTHTETFPPPDAPDEDADDTDAQDVDDPLVDGTAGAEPPDEAPEPETEVTTFTGNEAADEVWQAFAPLYALRELDLSADADLEAYGLDDPDATIEVGLQGRTVTVALGAEAYGTRDRYARVDEQLVLLDDKTIRPLQFAKTRMVERRLHPYEEKDIARVVVTRGPDTRTLVQRNADDRTQAYWADADTPETKDVEAGTWLGKLFRMRIRSYTSEDDVQGTLTPVFTAEIVGEQTWPVEVFEVAGEDDGDLYARVGFVRSLVVLTKSLAEEATIDLDTLFDGVDSEAPPEDEAAEDEAVPEDEAPDEDDGDDDE